MPAAIERLNNPLGAIAVDQSYPLPLFQRLTGLSTWAMREARKNGLKVKTVGRRRFVRGADWSEYLDRLEK